MSWCENACQSWSNWNQNSGILAANDSPEWFTHRRCFNKCWANKPWKMAHRNRWFLNIYDGLPIKNGAFPWQTVSHNQMVTHNPLPTMAPALFSDIGKGLHHSIAVGTRQQYHPAISETPVLEAWCHFCSKLNQCVASCGTNHGNLIALAHLLRFLGMAGRVQQDHWECGDLLSNSLEDFRPILWWFSAVVWGAGLFIFHEVCGFVGVCKYATPFHPVNQQVPYLMATVSLVNHGKSQQSYSGSRRLDSTLDLDPGRSTTWIVSGTGY